MIRSSRERNRSCSPVSCRSRGRIARPPSSSRGQGITASDSEESQKQFARKPQRRRPIPAKTITWKGSITHLVQRLGNTSRATCAPALISYVLLARIFPIFIVASFDSQTYGLFANHSRAG